MPDFADADLLLQRFYTHVNDRGDAVYLTQPKNGEVTTYTFKDVFDQAARMAAHLKGLGLEPQSKIGIVSKNCAHFFMAELAIWMAGHTTVALYPTLASDTVKYILDHSEAKLLFVGKLDTWAELQKGVPADLPCIALPLAPKTDFTGWDEITSKTEPIEGQPTRDKDDESLIIYTSGSTGTPKGVLHSFYSISAPTVVLADSLQCTKDDRLLSYLPLAHSMDRWLSFCMSLYAGNQIFFAESLDTFVKDLNRASPTLFVSVPRLWLKFQLGVFKKMPPGRLSFLQMIPFIGPMVNKKILTGLGLQHVRFAGSGSAPIPAELITWYNKLGLELLEGYGMSENFNFSHMTQPGNGRVGYIGNAHPGVECKLSDANEILIKSPGNMLGYFKAPELTKEAFTEDGFLRTGDQGAIDEQGRLKITGRVKEIFKTSKGKYVSPAPIENIINNDPNIELSVVAGSGYPLTHAVVQLGEDIVPTLGESGVKERITSAMESLLKQVNASIEEYEKVGFIVIAEDPWTIEGGQLTPTMKIKRTAIESLYTGKLDEWYDAGKKVIWE